MCCDGCKLARTTVGENNYAETFGMLVPLSGGARQSGKNKNRYRHAEWIPKHLCAPGMPSGSSGSAAVNAAAYAAANAATNAANAAAKTRIAPNNNHTLTYYP